MTIPCKVTVEVVSHQNTSCLCASLKLKNKGIPEK